MKPLRPLPQSLVSALTVLMFGILLNDQPFGNPNSLADFSIVRDNIIVCPDLPEGSAAARPVAIDVAADACAVSGNRVRYANRFYVGLRLTGSVCEAEGNLLHSLQKEVDILGPIAVQIGATVAEGSLLILGGIVAHNAIVGVQHGILCIDRMTNDVKEDLRPQLQALQKATKDALQQTRPATK